MNKLAIVPATILRGAIVAVLAQVSGAGILCETATLMISAVVGGATMAAILLWRAAVSRYDVWEGRLACTQCAQRSSPRVH